MTRDQATKEAQRISDSEGVAVYVTTPKRGRWAFQTFSFVRAKDAPTQMREIDQCTKIIRPQQLGETAQ